MGDHKRISVVDDYAEILEMIAEALSDEGFEVQTISDHHEAYERIKEWKPDLVMLDLMAGTVQAGWTVLDHLKNDSETRHIPVVLCSASSHDVRTTSKSPHAKTVEYLEKPFEIDTLIRTLDHLLNEDNSVQKKQG